MRLVLKILDPVQNPGYKNGDGKLKSTIGLSLTHKVRETANFIVVAGNK